MEAPASHILTLACPDRVGLVAHLAKLMERHACFISNSRTFSDVETGHFFARLVFAATAGDALPQGLMEEMAQAGDELSADWAIHSSATKMRTLLMVSKSDHCANTLLYAARRGELPIDVVGFVSNHDALKERFSHWNLPWFTVPVSADAKPEAEARLYEIIKETDAELTVLARYMQILSNDACRKLSGQCINIHHSFLPSFKGARPYHQAHARGVKVIGATAHYVTADLDEGPIISQAVEAVDHTFSPADLVSTGRHLEGAAVLRAVKAHSEHRTFIHDGRTVVFAR